jgi:1-acyl-sn-glycerol-3-phosphate acyltransferase
MLTLRPSMYNDSHSNTNMKPRPANPLQTIWIMCKTVVIMIRSCLPAAIQHMFNRLDMRWIDRELTRWSRRLLAAARVDYHIENPHQVTLEPGVAYILMCNHTSHYDIPLSSMAFPNQPIRMLAKQELRKVPLMGRAMAGAKFPFINRHDRQQAIQDLVVVKNYMQRDGIIIWIAPEGTRSPDGNLGPFKKGGFITAIQTKAQIIPIGIHGADKVLPAKTWRFHLHQPVTVRIGQPIDAGQYHLKNKDELMQKVRSAIQELSQPDSPLPAPNGD